MTTPTEQKKQVLSSLGRSASLSNVRTDGTTPSLVVKKTRQIQSPPTTQGLWLTFFFDGTGNNLDADVSTGEHSNVARLYQVHQHDKNQGVLRFYIPGIGTYFKDVGDPGNTSLGGGTGDRGEDRLVWAMKRMDERLADSDGHKTVHVALFGFSRGATLARAFALRIAQRCERVGERTWRIRLGQRTYPIRLYFMGLFDTVASVGVPMSANNAGSALSNLLVSTRFALWNRSGDDLLNLAFGNGPGADPAPGFANGHMAWADDLRIPEMVEDCLHMMAAHEIRNSFPVDSVLQGLKYPSNCREMVYPGAHSDVGGGYRRGEGARSRTYGSLLSMIPLRAMRDEALRAGVPLRTDIPNNEDFAEDPGSRDAFQLLCQRFNGYMNVSGWGGKPVGTLVLSHMKLYYQWRFHRIARDQKDRKAGRPTKDEALLREFEGGWKAETARLSKETEARRVKFVEHALQASALKNSHGARHKQEAIRKEEKFASIAKDEYLTLKARLDTLPSSDGSFLDYLKIYDAQLLEDARAIQSLAKYLGRHKLRPHYKALLEAYEAEQRGQGLRDMGIIQFFDTYVHDSLAAFVKDSTLPSDPRVIYIGGDDKLRYAVNQPLGQGFPTSAVG